MRAARTLPDCTGCCGQLGFISATVDDVGGGGEWGAQREPLKMEQERGKMEENNMEMEKLLETTSSLRSCFYWEMTLFESITAPPLPPAPLFFFSGESLGCNLIAKHKADKHCEHISVTN